jgi:hypothetical protein
MRTLQDKRIWILVVLLFATCRFADWTQDSYDFARTYEANSSQVSPATKTKTLGVRTFAMFDRSMLPQGSTSGFTGLTGGGLDSSMYGIPSGQAGSDDILSRMNVRGTGQGFADPFANRGLTRTTPAAAGSVLGQDSSVGAGASSGFGVSAFTISGNR